MIKWKEHGHQTSTVLMRSGVLGDGGFATDVSVGDRRFLYGVQRKMMV